MDAVGLNRDMRSIERRLMPHFDRVRRGPPFRHGIRFMLFMALMRMRTALPLRLMARLFFIDHVTLWRCCNLVIEALSEMFETRSGAKQLIVDTTATRVRCTEAIWYSGYKKQRVAKVQVLCDADGVVHSVSRVYPGSVHDKTIWNGEFGSVPHGAAVLADKAYSGGLGEGTVLFRPVRRNEVAWKSDPKEAKAANALLSKRRVRIEHVFAQLKTWRIIHHYYPMRPSTYATTFKAIAFIHNLNKSNKSQRANVKQASYVLERVRDSARANIRQATTHVYAKEVHRRTTYNVGLEVMGEDALQSGTHFFSATDLQGALALADQMEWDVMSLEPAIDVHNADAAQTDFLEMETARHGQRLPRAQGIGTVGYQRGGKQAEAADERLPAAGRQRSGPDQGDTGGPSA